MKTIDTKSWWYKNCVRQRKRKAKICDSCPFREDIEDFEKPNDIERSIIQERNIFRYFGRNILTEEQIIKLHKYWMNKEL